MKIPLIVGARPRHASKGPFVALSDGSWRVNVGKLVDTRLKLSHVDSQGVLSERSIGSGEIVMVEKGKVQLEFEHRGSEEHITVIAERM